MVAMQPVDEARIADAVRAAERGTRAELVCVMARTSSNYEFFPLVWAALAALATPWIAIDLTLWSVERVFLVQLLVFVVVLAILSVPPLRMRLVPRTIKRRRAHRAAAEQFLLRGLMRTRERTGVLIFVSLAERYARVIVDDGVSSRIAESRWTEAIAVLLAHAREGRMTEGYVAAVGLCGRLLAEHLPAGPDPSNELSDRFFLI